MTPNNEASRPIRPRRRQAGEQQSTLVEEIEADPRQSRELSAARFALSVKTGLTMALSAVGLDKAELSRRLNLSPSAVTQVIESDGNLRVATIARYARAMGYQASLRLDPVGVTTPVIDLPLPANIVTRAPVSRWNVVKLQNGGVWTSQTEAVEATTKRVVLETTLTAMNASMGTSHSLPTRSLTSVNAAS